jgi:hypothetical protein
VLGAGTLATALALGAAPAAAEAPAQEGTTVTVEAVHPLTGGDFHFIVEVASGGAPASDATVTATPTSPGGDSGSAVVLEPSGDGVYQGPVSLPDDGTWTVRIASSGPTGTLDYGFEVSGDTGTPVAPATTTTAAPTTTVAPAVPAATTTTTVAPTTSAPAVASTEVALATNADDGSDSSLPLVLLLVGAALVVALAGVPLALRIIRQSTQGRPTDGNGNGDADDSDGSATGPGDHAGPRISD